MKILHVDSGIQGANSFSRDMSAKVMAKLTKAHPDAQVQYLDLGRDPIPHLTEQALPIVFGFAEASDEESAEPEVSQKALSDFMDADVVVIGAGLYNLTVSSAMRAWIDRIVILNKTFRYSEEGYPIGLATDKRVILCVSRGGFYAEGSPAAAMEMCEKYLRAIFGFIGVGKLDVLVADGVSVGPDQRQAAVEAFDEQLADLAV